jgi:D-cysteine desulfhydrase
MSVMTSSTSSTRWPRTAPTGGPAFPGAPAVSVKPRVLDGHVGAGYGLAGPEVFELIAELAALEGLLLDPVYTGKAFHGMLAELAAGRFRDCRDIIFLHTGGVFGVFPQAQHFTFAAAGECS